MRKAVPLVLLLAGLAGCGSEEFNPFAEANLMAAPGADADFVFISDGHAPGGGEHEIYAASADTVSTPTRLTFCANGATCDTVEATVSGLDRARVMVRRVNTDTDGNGRVNSADTAALVFLDLARSVESATLPPTAGVTGLDWSLGGTVVVYSARGAGGLEDIYRIDPNGADNRPLTSTADARERRPRLDPSTTFAVLERLEGSGSAKANVVLFTATGQLVAVTTGGPGTDLLLGTPYVIGSDADPTFSPDGTRIAFRRLTAAGAGGRGLWDIMTVKLDGTDLRTVASGPLFRGAPDWDARGLLFPEIDTAAGESRVVLVQPDGSGRRTPVVLRGGDVSNPRWLKR